MSTINTRIKNRDINTINMIYKNIGIASYIPIDKSKAWEYIVDYACHNLNSYFKTTYHYQRGFIIEYTSAAAVVAPNIIIKKTPAAAEINIKMTNMVDQDNEQNNLLAIMLICSAAEETDPHFLITDYFHIISEIVKKIHEILNDEGIEKEKSFLLSERIAFQTWAKLGYSFTKSCLSEMPKPNSIKTWGELGQAILKTFCLYCGASANR